MSIDAPIEDRIAALRGLTLALPAPGSLTDLTVRQMLSSNGLDADSDLTVRPLNDPAALVTAAREGQVDGLAFSTPTSVQPVEEGYASVWISLSEVPQFAEMPFIDVITSRSYLEQNREAVSAFVSVLLDASEAIEADPTAAGDTIRTAYFPDISDGLWDLAWESTYATATGSFVPSEEGMDALLNVVNDQTDQPVNVTYDEAYDTSILDELSAGGN